MATPDLINAPPHYTQHASGVECIEISEHIGFNVGNAYKYLFRRNAKGNPEQDVKKAMYYLHRQLLHQTAHTPPHDKLAGEIAVKAAKVAAADGTLMGQAAYQIALAGVSEKHYRDSFLHFAVELLESSVKASNP